MHRFVLWLCFAVPSYAADQTASGAPVSANPAASGSTAVGTLAPASNVVADSTPISRTYAMRQTFTSQMREPNPFSNQEWRSTHTTVWALVRWTQTGNEVRYTETTCGLGTEKVFGAETIYPEAFVNAIEVRQRAGTIAGTTPGAAFRTSQYAQAFGVRLADPMKDALPTDPSDKRLVDTDGDGKPGATVIIRHPMVGTGHVYVAQRSIARLEGALQADGSVKGVVYTAPNMYKAGADTWWLRVDSPQRPHPDPKMSPFVMTPVADGATCAQVLAGKTTLFPPLTLAN